jgi:hypothetical protein
VNARGLVDIEAETGSCDLMARGERAPRTLGGEDNPGSVMRMRGELLDAGMVNRLCYSKVGRNVGFGCHISQRAYLSRNPLRWTRFRRVTQCDGSSAERLVKEGAVVVQVTVFSLSPFSLAVVTSCAGSPFTCRRSQKRGFVYFRVATVLLNPLQFLLTACWGSAFGFHDVVKAVVSSDVFP